MEDLKKLKVKNWKAIPKDRKTGRDLTEKVKTHKGLWCQMTAMRCFCYKNILGCVLQFIVYSSHGSEPSIYTLFNT